MLKFSHAKIIILKILERMQVQFKPKRVTYFVSVAQRMSAGKVAGNASAVFKSLVLL